MLTNKKDMIFVPAMLVIGIALITGIVIMNIAGIAALAIVHKTSAVLFVVLLAVLFAVLFVLKLCAKKA